MYLRDNMLVFRTAKLQVVAAAILNARWERLQRSGVDSWVTSDTRWSKGMRDRQIQFKTSADAETAFVIIANFNFLGGNRGNKS